MGSSCSDFGVFVFDLPALSKLRGLRVGQHVTNLVSIDFEFFQDLIHDFNNKVVPCGIVGMTAPTKRGNPGFPMIFQHLSAKRSSTIMRLSNDPQATKTSQYEEISI